MRCYNIWLTKGISYLVLRQAMKIVSESDTRVQGLTGKKTIILQHSQHSTHQSHGMPWHCRNWHWNILWNSTSNWQFTYPVTWIQASSLRRTSVVSITPSCAPSNNLWAYTTRKTYIDQHSTTPLTIHRSISTVGPSDVYVSCRRPDATLSYMAQN